VRHGAGFEDQAPVVLEGLRHSHLAGELSTDLFPAPPCDDMFPTPFFTEIKFLRAVSSYYICHHSCT
jgi:hypothetical protein